MLETIILSVIITTLVQLVLILIFQDKIKDMLSKSFAKGINRHNRTIRPNRILLIRHGQSQANVNVELYKTLPDNQIGLTEKGQEMALEAGKKLKSIIGDESVKFYVSPYKRTRQTFKGILQSITNNFYKTSFETRIREQEYGNLQRNMEEQFKEMEKCGEFFYRFVNGESGADVYNRGKKKNLYLISN